MALDFTPEGKEILDDTPVEFPLGYEHPLSLDEKIAQAIRQNDFNKLNNQLETFEEADDFEVDDDLEEFTSQYETKDMVDEYPIEQPGASSKSGETSPPEKEEVDHNSQEANQTEAQ